MLYSKLFFATFTGISCVAALPAEPQSLSVQRDRDRDERDPFSRGECRSEGDILYCGRSVNEFIPYDANSYLCYAGDQANRLFCAIRNQQELAVVLAAEFERIQRCSLNQYFDTREKRCDCYRRRDRDDDRDVHDCFSPGRDRDDHEPNCRNGDIAFCAASENLIITYQRGNEICDRHLGNYVFCADRERGRAREKARDHFQDRRDRD
ncbi:hypothetical protein CCHL11_00899 [Colletotrichum chlorophyti]|uniref:Uncharacterized protein n=1 Tax=Colletotrichum chlorophyti TaxID=708187 RepID=A0A1Q8S5H7_9PEZI|nr:hypothetical protein CCHL11_00899 [Colletotrichum chlorophyti]